ncbi:TatD family hydrolase [Moraxella nasovis]|uniref:TatD family hydrolase n=1 Tax=Moraxella nasovis TaxID=2904121 RepID=UPI001F622F38|nr:TatD family hydrolase [Moraxella nasovis]UNU74314.1 TatD family hydrolase [Moraxella nasovis]
MQYAMIDTHTHFDVDEYDRNRAEFANNAYREGVRHLLLIGVLAKNFSDMVRVEHELNRLKDSPKAHCAFGLHPLYIADHDECDLAKLEEYIVNYRSIAISEIGLDTYPKHFAGDILKKQQHFFIEQIHLAKKYNLPIILHIRKAHAQVLKILKEQKYRANVQGGIAHSFSGGEQEAIAFVKMGFKLGITGQITNPNAKKLRNAVMAVFNRYGAQAFVIETDSPDMLPLPCQTGQSRLNEPANLFYVLQELSIMFKMDQAKLADILWQNSNDALCQNWTIS